MGIRTPYLTVVQATGKYKETKNGAFLEAGINIFLSVILTIPFGIIGVVIGTLFANLFRTIQYYLFINKNVIERPKFILITNILWMSVNIIVSVLISSLLFDFSMINNYFNWAIYGFLTFCVSVFVTIIMSFLFKKKQLKGILNILKKR